MKTLDQQVAVRLTSADLDRLKALAERIPVVSRNAIARVALRIGMEALETDPARVVSGGTTAGGRQA